MERFFNTAGPQTPDSYTIDPLSRIDLDDVLTLIRQQRYFVLHAPRQTGKTTCMLALRDYLNREDDYIAVYVNVEAGQAKRNDVDSVVRGICDNLAEEFRGIIKSDLPLQLRDEARQVDPSSMLSTYLRRLAEALPKPIVLFIDEIDALVGDSLVSVLRQIRAGYYNRVYATCATTESCSPTKTSSLEARHLKSRPNHCDWAISRVLRFTSYTCSIPTRQDSSSTKPASP